jgi:hypothetical protein
MRLTNELEAALKAADGKTLTEYHPALMAAKSFLAMMKSYPNNPVAADLWSQLIELESRVDDLTRLQDPVYVASMRLTSGLEAALKDAAGKPLPGDHPALKAATDFVKTLTRAEVRKPIARSDIRDDQSDSDETGFRVMPGSVFGTVMLNSPYSEFREAAVAMAVASGVGAVIVTLLLPTVFLVEYGGFSILQALALQGTAILGGVLPYVAVKLLRRLTLSQVTPTDVKELQQSYEKAYPSARNGWNASSYDQRTPTQWLSENLKAMSEKSSGLHAFALKQLSKTVRTDEVFRSLSDRANVFRSETRPVSAVQPNAKTGWTEQQMKMIDAALAILRETGIQGVDENVLKYLKKEVNGVYDAFLASNRADGVLADTVTDLSADIHNSYTGKQQYEDEEAEKAGKAKETFVLYDQAMHDAVFRAIQAEINATGNPKLKHAKFKLIEEDGLDKSNWLTLSGFLDPTQRWQIRLTGKDGEPYFKSPEARRIIIAALQKQKNIPEALYDQVTINTLNNSYGALLALKVGWDQAKRRETLAGLQAVATKEVLMLLNDTGTVRDLVEAIEKGQQEQKEIAAIKLLAIIKVMAILYMLQEVHLEWSIETDYEVKARLRFSIQEGALGFNDIMLDAYVFLGMFKKLLKGGVSYKYVPDVGRSFEKLAKHQKEVERLFTDKDALKRGMTRLDAQSFIQKSGLNEQQQGALRLADIVVVDKDYLRRVVASKEQNGDVVLLGASVAIKGETPPLHKDVYEAFRSATGFQDWHKAYEKAEMPVVDMLPGQSPSDVTNAKSDVFLAKLIAGNKKIVFLMPTNIEGHAYVKRELELLLDAENNFELMKVLESMGVQKPQKAVRKYLAEHVTFVFGMRSFLDKQAPEALSLEQLQQFFSIARSENRETQTARSDGRETEKKAAQESGLVGSITALGNSYPFPVDMIRNLHPAREEDMPAIYDLMIKSDDQIFETEEDLLGYWRKPQANRFFVYKEGGRVVGFIAAAITDATDARIHDLLVSGEKDDKYRGEIKTLLMARLMQDLDSLGISKISGRPDPGAEELYKKFMPTILNDTKAVVYDGEKPVYSRIVAPFDITRIGLQTNEDLNRFDREYGRRIRYSFGDYVFNNNKDKSNAEYHLLEKMLRAGVFKDDAFQKEKQKTFELDAEIFLRITREDDGSYSYLLFYEGPLKEGAYDIASGKILPRAQTPRQTQDAETRAVWGAASEAAETVSRSERLLAAGIFKQPAFQDYAVKIPGSDKKINLRMEQGFLSGLQEARKKLGYPELVIHLTGSMVTYALLSSLPDAAKHLLLGNPSDRDISLGKDLPVAERAAALRALKRAWSAQGVKDISCLTLGAFRSRLTGHDYPISQFVFKLTASEKGVAIDISLEAYLLSEALPTEYNAEAIEKNLSDIETRSLRPWNDWSSYSMQGEIPRLIRHMLRFDVKPDEVMISEIDKFLGSENEVDINEGTAAILNSIVILSLNHPKEADERWIKYGFYRGPLQKALLKVLEENKSDPEWQKWVQAIPSNLRSTPFFEDAIKILTNQASSASPQSQARKELRSENRETQTVRSEGRGVMQAQLNELARTEQMRLGLSSVNFIMSSSAEEQVVLIKIVGPDSKFKYGLANEITSIGGSLRRQFPQFTMDRKYAKHGGGYQENLTADDKGREASMRFVRKIYTVNPKPTAFQVFTLKYLDDHKPSDETVYRVSKVVFGMLDSAEHPPVLTDAKNAVISLGRFALPTELMATAARSIEGEYRNSPILNGLALNILEMLEAQNLSKDQLRQAITILDEAINAYDQSTARSEIRPTKAVTRSEGRVMPQKIISQKSFEVQVPSAVHQAMLDAKEHSVAHFEARDEDGRQLYERSGKKAYTPVTKEVRVKALPLIRVSMVTFEADDGRTYAHFYIESGSKIKEQLITFPMTPQSSAWVSPAAVIAQTAEYRGQFFGISLGITDGTPNGYQATLLFDEKGALDFNSTNESKGPVSSLTGPEENLSYWQLPQSDSSLAELLFPQALPSRVPASEIKTPPAQAPAQMTPEIEADAQEAFDRLNKWINDFIVPGIPAGMNRAIFLLQGKSAMKAYQDLRDRKLSKNAAYDMMSEALMKRRQEIITAAASPSASARAITPLGVIQSLAARSETRPTKAAAAVPAKAEKVPAKKLSLADQFMATQKKVTIGEVSQLRDSPRLEGLRVEFLAAIQAGGIFAPGTSIDVIREGINAINAAMNDTGKWIGFLRNLERFMAQNPKTIFKPSEDPGAVLVVTRDEPSAQELVELVFFLMTNVGQHAEYIVFNGNKKALGALLKEFEGVNDLSGKPVLERLGIQVAKNNISGKITKAVRELAGKIRSADKEHVIVLSEKSASNGIKFDLLLGDITVLTSDLKPEEEVLAPARNLAGMMASRLNVNVKDAKTGDNTSENLLNEQFGNKPVVKWNEEQQRFKINEKMLGAIKALLNQIFTAQATEIAA